MIELEIVFRLVFAALLGGFIGIERESHKRPAGFRTHILVCVGSALVMIVGIYGFKDFAGNTRDPARLAAQVVSGIGFLGAGTIMREGANIRGLTTAASLWVVSGIGLAVGAGAYVEGFVATLLVALTLSVLDRFEKKYISSKSYGVVIKAVDRPGLLGSIGTVLGKHGVSITGVDLEVAEGRSGATIALTIEVPPYVSKTKLLQDLFEVEGVYKAEYEG